MKHSPRPSLSRLLLTGLVVAPLSLLLLACGSSDPDRGITAGRYRGEGIEVTLAKKGDAWSGKIQLRSQSFDVKARLASGKLEGSFQDGATSFPFSMVAAKKGFELSSGGSVYKLAKEIQKNPLAKENPLAKKNPLAAKNPLAEKNPLDPGSNASTPKAPNTSGDQRPSPPLPGKERKTTEAGRMALEGKLYKHALGFRFRYPKTWKMTQAGEGILALSPKDILQSPEGPLEVILVLGDSADGITDPKDPRVATELDQQMRTTFPFLKRKGKPKAMRLGGKEFSEHAWQGTNNLGKEIQGKAWTCILEESALVVLALMPPQQFSKRIDVLQAIAGSFHFKEPAKDPKLIGAWRNETSFSSGTFGSTTSRVMELRADGTSTWGSRTMASMTHTNAGGAETGSSSADSGAGDLLMGRWAGAQKRLYITWKNGSEEEFDYYCEGDSMLLTPLAGGKKQLWKKIR